VRCELVRGNVPCAPEITLLRKKLTAQGLDGFGWRVSARSRSYGYNRCATAGRGVPLPELLKFVATLLGGGLAGALLTEWYRRKHSRLQRIPLIERVNRLVSPKLQGGITLARRVGNPNYHQLVELHNLREYQLTLRNTSTVHCKMSRSSSSFLPQMFKNMRRHEPR
jgi:hypothetical protein